MERDRKRKRGIKRDRERKSRERERERVSLYLLVPNVLWYLQACTQYRNAPTRSCKA